MFSAPVLHVGYFIFGYVSLLSLSELRLTIGNSSILKSEIINKEGTGMKAEALWIAGIIIFSILFTASLGWGTWG
ncbi:hypothetical protein [Desulfonema magnum]|uniref:Uncharacterized protein n=1 Tax=Desulfonema magnum TaxID=45655 RepID=A0A975GN87_9BACT|nr:hypothetical protein [Desulfonema magnum]QTA86623.1 Uncharacterized protein dnm_026470 [Desulfonema magnum]